MSGPSPDPVVVVGLGPVGATVALLLARQGVRVVVVERDLEPYPHPRAVALDDEALRVLQAAGVLDAVELHVGGTVRLRGADGAPLVELPAPPTPTGHPALAFFRQPQLEGVLRAALAGESRVGRAGAPRAGESRAGEPPAGCGGRGGSPSDGGGDPPRPAGTATAGDVEADRRPPATGIRLDTGALPPVTVRLGVEVAGVEQDGDGVTVLVRAPGADGPPKRLRAAYVLACDGGRSGVRRGLGVRLIGRTSGRRWLVVDTAAPPGPDGPTQRGIRAAGPGRVEAGPAGSGEGPADPGDTAFAAADFEFACDPGRPWVHGPLPGGEHRWEFLLGTHEDADALRPAGVVADLLARRSSGPAPAVRRAAVYAFHSRVAARWRVGRVLLLGDAAHLAPPFAGQGLGAGLRDAHNLAWKVAAVVRGDASERLLDSYARERRPHVVRMTVLAAALGAVVQVRRPRTARARDAVMRTLLRSGRVRAWAAGGGWKPPSTIRRGVVATGRLGHRAGEAWPQSPVGSATAAVPGTTDEALGEGWALVGIGRDPGDRLGPAGRAAAARLRVRTLAVDADKGDPAGWLAPSVVALVRPDRTVFGSGAADDAEALLHAAAGAVGRPAGR